MKDVDCQIEDLDQQHDEEIDRRIKAFTVALLSVLSILESTAADLLESLPSQNGVARYFELQYLRRRLTAELAKLPYAELCREWVSHYDDAQDVTRAMLEVLGQPPHSRVSADDLRALRQIDLDKLARAGEVTVAMLSETIVAGSLTGLSDDEIKLSIRHTIKDFGNLALTYAVAGLLFYTRYLTWIDLLPFVDRWKYAGPQDEKNRRFCAIHVNNVYTREAIEEMKNDMANPAYQSAKDWCGGIGCRHRWRPQFRPQNA